MTQILGDNLHVMNCMETGSINMIYTDPPFNTNKVQTMKRQTATAAPDGSVVGFGGKSYAMETVSSMSYSDIFGSSAEYIQWLRLRVLEMHRLLVDNGSLLLHCDQNESHYIKVMLDQVFGRHNFRNEILWCYDYGGRSKRYWPKKHDTIFWYTKSDDYTYNYDAIDRIPYMAPGLVGPEKAARGKTPTDSWFMTIVPTNGNERTGYPTQKPVHLVRRIVNVHSNEGDLLLDPFAGSGTLGVVAKELDREYILIDSNTEALTVIGERLK